MEDIEAPIVNPELQRAWEYVENTGVSVFLTGRAGTGKTTFLQRLRGESRKALVVVAPTGVAAINARGVTIHSFFQLPTTPYVPGTQIKEKFAMRREKIRLIRQLDLLVIDEISMVRADLLDAVDTALRRIRNSQRPFGGVQLLMIGDLQQLAPVVTGAEEELIRSLYPTPYFFSARALQQVPYVTVMLRQVFRQQDASFITLLNHVRETRLTQADIDTLASRLQPGFVPSPKDGYVRLTTHNNRADAYNGQQLKALKGQEASFVANIKGNFPDGMFPTADELRLKEGAQVMFLKNDSEGRFYNGLIGTVTEVNDNHVVVSPVDGSEDVDVEPMEWENVSYSLDPATGEVVSNVQGLFTQLPLRLAWAITIHKSQGLTFDRVVIDAGASFSPGQAYVALSRCRTLEGVVLVTPLWEGIMQPDANVASYLDDMARAEQESIERLPAIKAEYIRMLLLELFDFDAIGRQCDSMARQVSSTFAKMYPAQHRMIADSNVQWRSNVIEVAHRWAQQIRTTSEEQLGDPAFVKRVSAGAGYFSQNLIQNAVGPMLVAKGIDSQNRTAMKRLRELLIDLEADLYARYKLLSAVEEQGFDPERFLQLRHQTGVAGDRPRWSKDLLAPEVVTLLEQAPKRATRAAKKPAAKKGSK